MPSRSDRVEIAAAIEGLTQSGSLIGLSDADLLARYVERPDPLVLEAIVTRHGRLVLNVCRQILTDPNDVDDSFQATFLVLIRKASSLKRRASLAS